MAERIVVCLRSPTVSVEGPRALAYLEAARSVRDRAEALGGVLCAWGVQSMAFDFAEDDLEEAIDLAVGELAKEELDGPNWCIGVSEGELLRLVESGSLALPGWGLPLVLAMALARVARPREILLDPEMRSARSGALLTSGPRLAREGARRIKALVLDRREPWRARAALNINRLAEPELVGREGYLGELLAAYGKLSVIRADAGYGGTRLLEEAARGLLPARALFLVPAGSEPYGSLRRAFARDRAAPVPAHLSPPLSDGLQRLLAGEGIELPLAAQLVHDWLTHQGTRGAALVDDAFDIDGVSLAALALALEQGGQAMRLLVRLDSSSAMPLPLSRLPLGPEIALGPLPRVLAEKLAGSSVRGKLLGEPAQRWARLGRFLPLGIVEAVAEGVLTAELSWEQDRVIARNRSPGLRKLQNPSDWVARRLAWLSLDAQHVLAALAVLGAETTVGTLCTLVQALDPDLAAQPVLTQLVCQRWVVVLGTQPDSETLAAGSYVRLASRTHRSVILDSIDDAERARMHQEASTVLELREGSLAHAEAARHAQLSGDRARAARLAIAAARTAQQVSLGSVVEGLLAFARMADLSSIEAGAPLPSPVPEDAGPGEDAIPIHEEGTGTAPIDHEGSRKTAIDQEGRAAGRIDEEGPATTPFPGRVSNLPLPALLEGELKRSPSEPLLVAEERQRAVHQLREGRAVEALRILRGLLQLPNLSLSEHARIALAHGVALARVGRSSHALLEGLEALSWARRGGDARGERACALFLAELSASAGKAEAARVWREVSQITLGG